MIEERDRYTSDIVFPASWNRPDERVVALDPWRVQFDDCRKHVPMSLEGETRTGDCPAGYSGPGLYDLWTDYWTQVVYAAPVPFVATHQLAGTYRRVPGGSESRCSPPPSTSGGNGGNGGGNDQNYWQDSQTGIIYSDRPPGSKPEDGNLCGCDGPGVSPPTDWEEDREEDDDD